MMANKTDILICDGNAICHRSIHTTGELKYNGEFTGIKYGFFSQLYMILQKYKPENICFVWDSRSSKRKEIYPSYKEKRSQKKKEQTKEEKIFYGKCFEQFDELYEEILPKIGIKNNYKVKGLEGDDLIASICLNNKGRKVIATSDNDMYQLLNNETVIYDIRKKKEFTKDDFFKEYEIDATEWVNIKCMAGCSSDEVEGIDRVGIDTAIKYLKKQLKEKSKIYQRIVSDKSIEICDRNIKLVKLPFEGTPKIKVEKNKVNFNELKSVFLENGFYSFYEREKFNEWRKLLC
jgi:DNA polymerase-1